MPDTDGRRLADVIVSLSGLVLLAPLLLVVALSVLLGSGSPVLHREQRLGRGGHPFTLYKVRSLRVGTGDLCSVAPDNDPRITAPGRILRRWRLDELPQFYNVLRGDMTLVGPRPLPPRHAAAIPGTQLERLLSVRPGITGLAALQFLAEDTALAQYAEAESAYLQHLLPAKLELDLRYVDEATPCRDLGLVLATVATLWSRRARRESYRRVSRLLPAVPDSADTHASGNLSR